MRTSSIAVMGLTICVLGCSSSSDPTTKPSCLTDSQCPSGMVCIGGSCMFQRAGLGGSSSLSPDVCLLGCQGLDTCDLCIGDSCLSVSDCASYCRSRGMQGAARCIVQGDCTKTRIDACLATGENPSTGGATGIGGVSTSTGGRGAGGNTAVAGTSSTTGGSEMGGSATGGTSTNPCANKTCSGHGTCSDGVCACATGYAGADCDSCVSGYGVYPTCTPCNCTEGAQACNGSTALNTCEDGCHFTSSACTSLCQSAGYVRATGCSYSSSKGADICYCSDSTSTEVQIWSFWDECPDGLGMTVQLFDYSSSTYYTSQYLSVYDQAYSQNISCTPGHMICYGAWNANYTWGCGQNCARTCADTCCWTCGTTHEIARSLTCSSL
jgi:hypothetical protein